MKRLRYLKYALLCVYGAMLIYLLFFMRIGTAQADFRVQLIPFRTLAEQTSKLVNQKPPYPYPHSAWRQYPLVCPARLAPSVVLSHTSHMEAYGSGRHSYGMCHRAFAGDHTSWHMRYRRSDLESFGHYPWLHIVSTAQTQRKGEKMC